jgi:hypothetical protein
MRHLSLLRRYHDNKCDSRKSTWNQRPKNLPFVSEQETLGKLLEQHLYEAW